MADNLDIYIRFLIDQTQRGYTEKAIDSLERQIKDFEKTIRDAKQQANEFRAISERIGQSARGLMIAGTAITGGIFGFAAKYVKDAKEATAVTERWKSAQEKLSAAGTRVGAVMAETALPLLEKAAGLAEKAAAFVESHPEIIRAALNTGMVIAALGAVGTAVAKGIRLYADVLYYAALIKEQQGIRIFDNAVNKFLIAAAKIDGIPWAAGATRSTAGAGGLMAFGKYLLTGIGALLAGAFIGDKLFDAIDRAMGRPERDLKDDLTALKQAVALLAFGMGKAFGGQQKGEDWFRKVRDALGLAESDAESAANSIREMSAEGKKAFAEWKAADAKLVADAAARRTKILAEIAEGERASRANYQVSLRNIAREASRARNEAIQSYAQESQRAEEEYANERASIIRDAGAEIQRIERDHQEKMRKMVLEHNNRVADLVADRDALGLVKEQRRFAQEKAEAEREVNETIAQEKAETALRLRELSNRHAEERAERERAFQEQLRQIARAASDQRRQAREAHMAEMADLRNSKAQQLRELQDFLNKEREAKRRQYIQMLQDLGQAIPPSMSSSSTTTGYSPSGTGSFGGYYDTINTGGSSAYDLRNRRAGGGYADYGMYLLGDRPGGGAGDREFVMSGNTTRAAERAMGGQLTQDKILAALAVAGGSRNVNYTDNRRMPSQGPIDREMLREDMRSLLRQELKNVFGR